MEPTDELVDAIYREKVFRHRRMTPQRRVEIGADLSDVGREIMSRGDSPGESIGVGEAGTAINAPPDALSRRLDNIPLPELVPAEVPSRFRLTPQLKD